MVRTPHPQKRSASLSVFCSDSQTSCVRRNLPQKLNQALPPNLLPNLLLSLLPGQPLSRHRGLLRNPHPSRHLRLLNLRLVQGLRSQHHGRLPRSQYQRSVFQSYFLMRSRWLILLLLITLPLTGRRATCRIKQCLCRGDDRRGTRRGSRCGTGVHRGHRSVLNLMRSFFFPIFPRREYYFCSCTVVHRSTGLNLRIFRNAMPSSRRNVVSFCILFLAYSLLAEPRACPSCLVVIFPPYCN